MSMKPPSILAITALLLWIVCISQSADEEEWLHDNIQGLSENDSFGPVVHPCFNTTKNQTVTTPEGQKILCLVPSEDDLVKDLEALGGFNRRYTAVTKEQVDMYFEDPFKTDSKPIEWESKFTGKRRRSIHENEERSASDETLERKKRSVSVGVQKCEKKATRTSENFYQLCDECWYITQLPPNKFPRYINEKICGTTGASSLMDICAGNTGFCIQKEIIQDLLIQTNQYEKIPSPDSQYSVVYKQVWKPFSQKIRSCCQCQSFTP